MGRQLGALPSPSVSPVTGPFRDAARLLRTLRHLRVGQMCHLVLQRLKPAPSTNGPVAPRGEMPPVGQMSEGLGLRDTGANPTDQVRHGVLTFLNRSHAVGFPPDWRAAGMPRLWLYNLHYHEFLQGLPFETAREVALDWIRRHRPGRGQVGWEPYPLSLRLSVWCSIFLGIHRTDVLADAEFRDLLWASLVEQAGLLCVRPERHLLGNHLLENGAALALVGSLFDHPSADAWQAVGRRILEREFPEQILADGGHCERSPMYQARVLQVLRHLAAAGDAGIRELVTPYVERLAKALAVLSHPDGGIALLNDSAFGVVPSASTPDGGVPEGPFALPNTGYYGARTGTGNYVVCDAGPLGPDYQPGHGHADLFSFELSFHGTRVFVDCGVATYESGPLRDYCRSTCAHNTVEIEGRDQAELWGAFRVGRRPRPQAVAWQQRGGAFELSAHHHGYRHLPGGPIHARTFRWRPEGRLELLDRVDASRSVRATARLHLHPSCHIVDLAAGQCSVRFASGAAAVRWSGWKPTGDATESLYCPEFGCAIPNTCLELSATGARISGTVTIELA